MRSSSVIVVILYNYLYLNVIHFNLLKKGVLSESHVLREKNGKEEGVFTGHQPRQAALKAANRSKGTKSKPVELRLRERGTKKVHIFKGWTEVVAAPKNKPKWMPAKINKPNVKKVSVELLEKV
jgi:hypothetical protein